MKSSKLMRWLKQLIDHTGRVSASATLTNPNTYAAASEAFEAALRDEEEKNLAWVLLKKNP